jgi:hypothetical protein
MRGAAFPLVPIIAAAVATSGCAVGSGSAPSAAVAAERFRVVATSTYQRAVRTRYQAEPLLQPSFLYRAGWVFGLDVDTNNVTFAASECDNLFVGGVTTTALTDVSETSLIRSGADGEVLSDMFGAGFADNREARVEIGIKGVQEERAPPRSLQRSLFKESCVSHIVARMDAAKAEQRRLRMYVVVRSIQARDLYFDVSFKSETRAAAALAVLSGKYQATALNAVTLRTRPSIGLNVANEPIPFALNNKTVQEIVPDTQGRIRLKPVS